MRDGKDELIRKVEQYKPLIVCFNGKGLCYNTGNTKHVEAPSKHYNKNRQKSWLWEKTFCPCLPIEATNLIDHTGNI